MIDFFPRLLIATLVILGIWNATGPGMILERVGNWLERAPKWFSKPIGLCPPCMAGVHGTWIWFFLGGDWKLWPIFVLALSGLMVLIVKNLFPE